AADDARARRSAARRGEGRAVEQAVADGLRLVHEAARDRGSTLARQARESDGPQEPAARNCCHLRIVAWTTKRTEVLLHWCSCQRLSHLWHSTLVLCCTNP